MVDKVIAMEEAISRIQNGDTIMVGGFMANGTPERIIDALIASGKKDLTLVCNDTATPEKGVGRLVTQKRFKKIITSHIGTNKETGRQMNEGETEIVLIPQGTLVEQIRAAGYGLGGILTPTGIGTLVEEGKEKIIIDGEEYLLEKPIKADVAILFGSVVDHFGNIVYEGSMNNFNHVMASAADTTIVEAGKIVEIGELDPNRVITPGVFVDYVVGGMANG